MAMIVYIVRIILIVSNKTMLYDWSNRTVLIAEDDEMNFRYLEVIFEKYTGINVIWAINGKMAVDYCQIYDYIDIVIMDIQLPVVDGLEATKQIKSFKPDLPIIAHTANTYNNEVEKSLAAGCDDYISKPVNFEDLLSRIESFLNPVATK